MKRGGSVPPRSFDDAGGALYNTGMKREKLLSHIFTSRVVRFDDVVTALTQLGFSYNKSAEGSRVRFKADDGDYVNLHRPHPGTELKRYQLVDVRGFLERQGFHHD